MIGLMNIPEDAPTEFFAVRPQKPQQTPSTALARPPKPLICRTSMDTREGGLIMMTHSTREQKQEEVDEEEEIPDQLVEEVHREPQPRRLSSIFGHRRQSPTTVTYLADGRKKVAGVKETAAEAKQLWEQLFHRTFVHQKIEDEANQPLILQGEKKTKKFSQRSTSPPPRPTSGLCCCPKLRRG